MKGFFFLLLALISVSAYPTFLKADINEIDIELQANAFVDFVRGFLKGLNVKGDIENILKCAEGGEHAVEKIIIAIQFLIHIDIKHIEDIIKGLKMLFEAVMEIIKIIDPCTKSVPEIAKLVAAILGVNIFHLAWKLITNAAYFYHDIMDCIDAFKKNDYEKAGKCIGDFLYRLFLEAGEQSDPVIEFMKGFFKGLDEKGNVEDILKCLENIEPIINDIIKAFTLILTFEMKKVYEGVIILVAAIKKLMDIIKPCTKSYEQIQKLMAAIAKAEIMKIIKKIIYNPGVFYEIISNLVKAFLNGQFYEFGFGTGKFLFKIFLEETYFI